MQLVLTKGQLSFILRKLMMGDMFPYCVINSKGGCLFSLQREEYGRALRFVKFKESYFDKIYKLHVITPTIEIDAEKLDKMIRIFSNDTIVSVRTDREREKLVVTSNGINVEINYNIPKEILTSLADVNIAVQDGMPIVGEERIQLDKKFCIKLSDMKKITKGAKSTGTEFYKFTIQPKIAVKVGDLYEGSNKVIYHLESTMQNGFRAIFTYGISQVAQGFNYDPRFMTQTDAPAWIYETNKHYFAAVLIPPYIE